MGNEGLDRLEERAKALNAESDTITKTITAIEDRLNRLGLGVEVEQEGNGFGKIAHKRWGFYRVHDGTRRPLIECPRKDRVDFAPWVERLIDELSRKAEHERERIESANVTLANQLRRLEG